MIIDATDLIVGRFATRVAKTALMGEKVHIINCDKAIISGRKKEIISDWQRKRDMGTPAKGPIIPRKPDMFVKRMIRGMLPYKQPKGREAFKRIMCHTGVPDPLKGKETEDMKEAHMGKLPLVKFIRVGELCKILGAKL